MTNMIYALVGPHATGKSTLAAQLISMGLHFIPTYVTGGQAHSTITQDSHLYRRVTAEEFRALDLIARYTHKGEVYGICKKDVLDCLEHHRMSVLLLEPTGIQQLKRLLKKKLSTVYLMVDYVNLVDRMLKMGASNDDIKYHLQYAENNKEFDGWKQADFVIKNIGEPEQALSQLLAIMGLATVIDKDRFAELTR